MRSSWSATVRMASMAGMTLSRMYLDHLRASSSGWFSARLTSSSLPIAFQRSFSRPSDSVTAPSRPAAFSSARCRAAAGRIIVRAIDAAVSASMFSLTAYCSSATS